jgi:NADP-dependent 3-hydroxy acid dehydrogenase YdfG
MGEALRADLNGSGVRVTVIEPGIVHTPLYSMPPEYGLAPADVAQAVLYAVSQPAHVDVNALTVRPTAQPH